MYPETNKNSDEKTYSLNNHNNKYKRTEDINVEYFFENEDILNVKNLKDLLYRYSNSNKMESFRLILLPLNVPLYWR